MASTEEYVKTMCRDTTTSWRRQQVAVVQLLRHAIIVTDPHKLAHLNAEAAMYKSKAERDRQARRKAAF